MAPTPKKQKTIENFPSPMYHPPSPGAPRVRSPYTAMNGPGGAMYGQMPHMAYYSQPLQWPMPPPMAHYFMQQHMGHYMPTYSPFVQSGAHLEQDDSSEDEDDEEGEDDEEDEDKNNSKTNNIVDNQQTTFINETNACLTQGEEPDVASDDDTIDESLLINVMPKSSTSQNDGNGDTPNESSDESSDDESSDKIDKRGAGQAEQQEDLTREAQAISSNAARHVNGFHYLCDVLTHSPASSWNVLGSVVWRSDLERKCTVHMFFFMLADDTGCIRVVAFGDEARIVASIVKVGMTVKVTNANSAFAATAYWHTSQVGPNELVCNSKTQIVSLDSNTLGCAPFEINFTVCPLAKISDHYEVSVMAYVVSVVSKRTHREVKLVDSSLGTTNNVSLKLLGSFADASICVKDYLLVANALVVNKRNDNQVQLATTIRTSLYRNPDWSSYKQLKSWIEARPKFSSM